MHAVADVQGEAGQRAGELEGGRAALHEFVAEVEAGEDFFPGARLDVVVDALAAR